MESLEAAVYTCAEAKAAGYTLEEIKAMGYGGPAAGYTIAEMKAAGYVEGLKRRATCAEARAATCQCIAAMVATV